MKDGQIKNIYQNAVANNDLSVVIGNLNVLHFSIHDGTRYMANMYQVILTYRGKAVFAIVIDTNKKAVVFSTKSPKKANLWMLKKYYSTICTD